MYLAHDRDIRFHSQVEMGGSSHFSPYPPSTDKVLNRKSGVVSHLTVWDDVLTLSVHWILWSLKLILGRYVTVNYVSSTGLEWKQYTHTHSMTAMVGFFKKQWNCMLGGDKRWSIQRSMLQECDSTNPHNIQDHKNYHITAHNIQKLEYQRCKFESYL